MGFFLFEIITNVLVSSCRVVLSEAVDGCICFTRKIQTESDPDPKVRKMSITFNDCATSELSMRAWN